MKSTVPSDKQIGTYFVYFSQIASAKFENPCLDSSLSSRLSECLQGLPCLQELAIANPSLDKCILDLKTIRRLKLGNLHDYCEDWQWLTKIQGLEEIDVSFINTTFSVEESLLIHDSSAEIQLMTTQGTLKIMENLPEYMRNKVLIYDIPLLRKFAV